METGSGDRRLAAARRLAAFLLLFACGCSSRLWRFTPLDDSSSSERMNAWPIAFVDDDGAAVLWPLMDFDSRGFAVRPLISKDDSEWDVLFPLSHIDADAGEGWALLGYSFNDNAGLFPVANFGPSLNFVIPFWWYLDGDEVASAGIFPVATFGRFSYVGTAWWGDFGDGDAGFGLVPLFTWADLKQIGPAYWHETPGEGVDWWGFFPLVYSANQGDQLLVLPLYWHELSDERTARALLLPPTWWETSSELERHFVFPFYAHVEKPGFDLTAWPPFYARSTQAGSTHWFTPVADGWTSGDRSGLDVYPLWWSARGPDESRQMLVPLWYFRERGSERLLITPLGGRGWDASGETEFVNFLGPVFHHSSGPELESTSVLWPLFQREREGDTTSTLSFPFFSWTSAPDRTSAWMAAGLARYVATDSTSSFRLWPLYAQSHAPATPDLLYEGSLFCHRSFGETWATHLFPLYSGAGDATGSEQTALLRLARVKTTETGSAWRLWPLASGSSDPAADGWIDVATLFRLERTETSHRGWLFPLWYGSSGPDHQEQSALLIAGHKSTPAGSAWRLFPLFSTTNATGLDDLLDPFTLIGVHPQPEKTHVHVGTSLLFAWDREGPEKRSWDARVLTFFDVGHQELQLPDASIAPTDPIQAESSTLLERDHAGFLFDWFLLEQRKVRRRDGAVADESHYRLPLLHEYERTDRKKEWDLLCYTVHSVETPEVDEFSVLWRAYHRVERGSEVKRDMFPFITYDTSPSASRFSFLWRFFDWRRDGDKRSGHVLFIPWGDPQ